MSWAIDQIPTTNTYPPLLYIPNHPMGKRIKPQNLDDHLGNT